tara:strand:- start:1942 stop:2283 length:342 start_codon:yes stop_codon:yes gene_type:complete
MTSIVSKPWGNYQIIEKGKTYVVKRIVVNPGGMLSLQSHDHRSEHWIIVKGQAEVLVDEENFTLKINDNIFVPPKSKHRLTNKQNEDLIVIEVWLGDILDEEDIIRYEDIYNR